MKKIILISLYIVSIHKTYSQSKSLKEGYPEVGKPMPEFVLNDVENFYKKIVKLQDFKGKWTILDFWTENCTSCIKSFPKMDSLQRKYQGQMQLLMVGLYSEGNSLDPGSSLKRIKKVFEYYSKKFNVKLPIAFDSAALDKFGIRYVPHILIINPSGIVAAVTTKVEAEQLKKLFAGEKVTFKKAVLKGESLPEYDESVPFLTNGTMANGGIDTAFLFRSILAKWNPTLPSYNFFGFNNQRNESRPGKAEIFGADLPSLLRTAFFGYRYWNNAMGLDSLYQTVSVNIIWENSDTVFHRRANQATDDNLYCYSVIVPLENSTPEKMRKILLNDIENTFTIKATVVERKTPVYKVIVIDRKIAREKLPSKGGETKSKIGSGNIGISLKNVPFGRFIKSMTFQSLVTVENDPKKRFPILDETELTFNVDFEAPGISLYDINEVKSALNKYGLDIILSEKPMKVIVVTDGK